MSRFEGAGAAMKLGVMRLAERHGLRVGDLEADTLPARVVDVRGFHTSLASAISLYRARAAAEPLEVLRKPALGVSLAAVAVPRAGVDADHATT